MTYIWLLKLQRWRTERSYAQKFQTHTKNKASREEFGELESAEHFDLQECDEEIKRTIALRLYREAVTLDIDLPPYPDPELWTGSDDGRYVYLSNKGRSAVRKLIGEEKARRFEVKTLWVTRFWIPLLAASIGIIGALTGFFAVLQHKK